MGGGGGEKAATIRPNLWIDHWLIGTKAVEPIVEETYFPIARFSLLNAVSCRCLTYEEPPAVRPMTARYFLQ